MKPVDKNNSHHTEDKANAQPAGEGALHSTETSDSPNDNSGLLNLQALQAAVAESETEEASTNEKRVDSIAKTAAVDAPVFTPQPRKKSGGGKFAIFVVFMAVASVAVYFVSTKRAEDRSIQHRAEIAVPEQTTKPLSTASESTNDVKRTEDEREPPAPATQTESAKNSKPVALGSVHASGRPKSRTRGKRRQKNFGTSRPSSGSEESPGDHSAAESNPETSGVSNGESISESNGNLESDSNPGPDDSEPDPKPDPTRKAPELDNLLGAATQKNANRKEVKDNLDRNDVQKGMRTVTDKVRVCGAGQSGTLSVKVVIGKAGEVISAAASGPFAGTPAGNCAARAVKHAKFPQSKQNLTVRYPFKL